MVETEKKVPRFAFPAVAIISGKHLTNFHAWIQKGRLIQPALRKKVVCLPPARLGLRAGFS